MWPRSPSVLKATRRAGAAGSTMRSPTGPLELALAQVPAPRRVLDVGCGTGYLLRQLAARAPDAVELVGVDAAAEMVRVAQESTTDPRVRFQAGTAEHLTEPDGAFDLIVSTTSFDHWADQQAGLRECARVMAPGGRLVLVDQFSPLYLPTLIGSRRGKARTRRRATRLLTRAGFRAPQWHARVCRHHQGGHGVEVTVPSLAGRPGVTTYVEVT